MTKSQEDESMSTIIPGPEQAGAGEGQQGGEGWVSMQAGQRKGPSKLLFFFFFKEYKYKLYFSFPHFQARLFILEDYAGESQSQA